MESVRVFPMNSQCTVGEGSPEVLQNRKIVSPLKPWIVLVGVEMVGETENGRVGW